jgi:peptidyl-prolyl cis-trans isomerase SurA
MTLRNSIFLAPALALLALTATGHAQSVSTVGDKIAKANAKAGAAPQQSPYQGTVVADIIARVNDNIISQADYDRAEQELEQQAKQRNWSEAETEDNRKQLLRDLIDNQLLLSKGKELGITGEAETLRQLDDLRKQNHLESMEDLQKAAEAQGVSYEDFKASIRNRVITSQVIRDEVGRRINITQADEQAFYDAHKADFDRPEEVRLSEILIPTPNPDDAAQVASAEAKANDLEKELKGGKDFAAVSKASSGGPTAASGGEIGVFKRGQLAKVLEDQTFDLKPGGYTAPIRTKQGYVILKVDAHQEGGIAPFSAVEGEIQDQVGMQKMNPALRAYLLRLREEAYIDIKPGYIDSGASANETKPIFSAYTPPQPKKKKKLERTRFGGRGRTRTHETTQTARGAAPGGVPSLADVPQGAAGETAVQTGAAQSSTAAPAQANAKAASPVQTATAGTMKPGKKEKIRYGQAPRETLPAGASQTEDAGATAANGNGSNSEQQIAAEQAPANTGLAPTTPAPAGARYSTGESAGVEAAPVAEEKKTRFSDRAKQAKVKKIKKKDRVDPFAPAPADSEEVATKQTQDAPLGLSGDTSKKPAKVKTTGPKTRYSDESKADLKMKQEKQEQPATPAPALTTPAAPAAAPAAPTAQDTPASPAGPSANPDAHTPTGVPEPAPAQASPNGTGDPLGPTVPAPQPPQ